MEVYVARQPIFDKQETVYGYELLYRDSLANFFNHEIASDKATSILLTNSYLSIGMETLVEDKLAFVNFDKTLLMNKLPYLLEPDKVIIEILENVTPDPRLLKLLAEYKAQGYRFAIDDCTPWYPHQRLLEIADFVKVDFRQCTHQQAAALVAQHWDGKKKFVAEKIETQADFQFACQAGFDFFQGYFFSQPMILTGSSLRGFKLQYSRLKQELAEETPCYERLASIIETDIEMAYKILTLVNRFALVSQVSSIRHALSLLGLNEVKKWVNFTIIQELSFDKPDELLRMCVLRSKLCELIAQNIPSLREHSYELGFTGLFSMIDVLLEAPMEKILCELPLSALVKRTLLEDHTSAYLPVLNCAIHYAKGDFKDSERFAQAVSLSPEALPPLYLEAIHWTDGYMELFNNQAV